MARTARKKPPARYNIPAGLAGRMHLKGNDAAAIVMSARQNFFTVTNYTG